MDNGASSYRRFLAGDETGIVEIIRLYRDGLILYINSFTQNTAEAEDIAEDVFLKLIMKKPKYNGKASFKTWLYTIAGNLARDYWRKNSRHGKVPLESLSEFSDDEIELERMYLKDEQKIQLHRSIKKLSSEYQQILWLVYFEGMSNKEASKIVGKSVHTTGNLVYKARKALKIQLERDGFIYENL
jgi:RNA polymerase sigma-70 factor (ECF subfamily)